MSGRSSQKSDGSYSYFVYIVTSLMQLDNDNTFNWYLDISHKYLDSGNKDVYTLTICGHCVYNVSNIDHYSGY